MNIFLAFVDSVPLTYDILATVFDVGYVCTDNDEGICFFFVYILFSWVRF